VKQGAIHSHTGLVVVFWREDLHAIHLKWHSEYDQGSGVQDAVRSALKYVNQNGVKNWLVDISDSDEALSEKDYDWVSGNEFRDLIRASTLRRFVMIPPGAGSAQDTSWIADWEKNTLSNFGNGIVAKVSSDMAEISAFFEVETTGEDT
jgi:hypothetical protein